MIDIHSDDFAYSVNSSRQIIELVKNQKLDSISIMPNMASFEECMELFYNAIPSFSYLPLLSVHVNLVEGYSLSKQPPLSSDGIINLSWGKLFAMSFIPFNSNFKNQLSQEIELQIKRVNEAVSKSIEIAKDNNIPVSQYGIRIDTHVHTHPIPIVWKSLIDVIERNNLNIEYIRNPKEPLGPFVKNKIVKNAPFVNIVKNRILMMLSKKIDSYCEKSDLPKQYMCGLLFSGNMDERVKKIKDELIIFANNDKRDMELLFHPGMALKGEYSKEKKKEFFDSFNSSNNRQIEYQSVMMIK